MSHFPPKAVSLFVIVAIVLFVVPGLLHEIIPHDHHGTAYWETVHSTLAYENKKFFLLSLLGLLCSFIARDILNPVLVSYSDFLPHSAARDPLLQALSVGTLSYRKFL